MRKREFLSPTSISLFKQDKEQFYLKYLADTKQEYVPQTQAMSVGSAFDAYVKSWLHEKVFGKGFDPAFEFDTIFTTQVEEHNRDWARDNGQYVFECYQRSGALQDLLVDLMLASQQPRFEFDLRGIVDGSKHGILTKVNGVPFLGKPDLHYKNKNGVSVVFDWKVNGYCSKSAKSPNPGYIRLRTCDGTSISGPHKNVLLKQHEGITIADNYPLEKIDEDWAAQLSIYSWLLGEPIGGDFVVTIHQIVAKPDDKLVNRGRPILRVAEHVTKVSEGYQKQVYQIADEIWHGIETGHIFSELSSEENASKCALLEQRAKEAADLDPLFKELSGRNVW